MGYRIISEPLQRKAIKELNEDPTIIRECLLGFREWLQKQSHLNVRSDDDSLLIFLRGCKWSLQRSKERIDYFYTMRTFIPEFFSNRDPLSKNLQQLRDNGHMFPLPNPRSSDGPRICYIDYGCFSLDTSPVDLIKYFFMSLDILLQEDDHALIAGIEFIINMKGLPFSYLLQFTPAMVMKAMQCVQNAYPLRIKRFLLINANPAIEKIVNSVFRPFFKKKLNERVHMFTSANSEEMYKYIPKSFFPEELGGDNGFCIKLAEQWNNKMESKRKWFLEDSNYKNDECLRAETPRLSADEFGMVGSFKKLCLD